MNETVVQTLRIDIRQCNCLETAREINKLTKENCFGIKSTEVNRRKEVEISFYKREDGRSEKVRIINQKDYPDVLAETEKVAREKQGKIYPSRSLFLKKDSVKPRSLCRVSATDFKQGNSQVASLLVYERS